MFTGLVLTSISAAVMQSALFQRKSRTGWLEELDGIRQDALESHEGGVANVADADDIWTDLRDGGEYEDPHEISSLYATDATPDLPVTKPAPRSRAKAKPAPAAEPPAPAAQTLPPPPPVAETLPPPPSPAPVLPPPPVAEPAPMPMGDAPAAEASAGPGPQYDDQIWVQPAPHPIRPSEMWHPAELAPAPLPDETFEPIREERVASSELMDPTYSAAPAPGPAPVPEPAPVADPATVSELEHELTAAADAAIAPPSPAEITEPTGGLVAGPVGRRVRRDRPTDRPKAPLPAPGAHVAPVDRGEQSPLPTAPLPPAALPTRSNRLPGIETLPATPSSVVPPQPAAAAPAPAPAPVVPAAPQPEPVAAAPAPVVDPMPVAPAPVAEATRVTPDPAPLTIGLDGLVDAPGTIVRIGGQRRARAAGSPEGVVVALDEGWCWASPGDGAASALRVDLPNGSLTVEPGATALAVVEADGSVFLIVAAGSAYLARGDDGATVARGTIVMIDPSGSGQTDRATDAEIEADPIVAENLALDAEL